jgi:hypothetical protein
MKLAFLIEKINYYTTFGSVIDEALKRNIEVFCLHDMNPENHKGKPYLIPFPEKLPHFQFGTPLVISYIKESEIISIIKTNKIDVLITIHFPENHISLLKDLQKNGVKIASLQHSLDTILNSKYLDQPDRYYLYSEKMLEFSYNYLIHNNAISKKNFDEFKENLTQKIRIVGFPEMDQCNNIDPQAVKKEWDLTNKPIALLLPYPFGSGGSGYFWGKYIYGMNNPVYQLMRICLAGKFNYIQNVRNGWNDLHVVNSIKKFCDYNNMQLIVKSRLKDPVRKYVAQNADKILYDEEYYPATILKCLSISDICFHFSSTVVFESAYMGVPPIDIMMESIEHLDTYRKDKFTPMQYARKELSDCKEITYLMSIPDCIKKLPTQRYTDYATDKDEQRKYVERYLGYFDGKSSERMLNDLELLVG